MTRVHGSTRLLAAAAAALLCLPQAPQAHNGAIAVAFPVSGITLDGDLSDWPDGLVRYSIASRELGSVVESLSDTASHFRVAFDPDGPALYLAVEARDGALMTENPETGTPWERDGCEVYLDFDHPLTRSGGLVRESERMTPEDSTAQYAVWGRQVYVPTVRLLDPESASRLVGYQLSQERRVYEWRIDLPQGLLRPEIASSIGFDVAIPDRDAEGTFTWTSWGPEPSKIFRPERLGDLVLAPSDTVFGEIRGRVDGLASEGLHLQSATSPLLLTLRTDRLGRFAGRVPAGAYQARRAYLDTSVAAVEPVQAHAGRVSEYQVRFGPEARPGTRRQPAGPGTRAIVGAGYRSGPWHSLTAADGLPASSIRALCVDQRDRLWLSFYPGAVVACYDGYEITAYTPADGLPDAPVRCILEDRAGDLWFGTEGAGLVRYDGDTFRTYTTDDGFPDPQVTAGLLDGNGDLWFGYGDVGGLVRFDGRSFHDYGGEFPGRVNDILQDRMGRVWVATRGAGLYRLDGDVFTAFAHREGMTLASCYRLAEDQQGGIWVAGRAGVCRWDGTAFTSLGPQDGVPEGTVSGFLVDRLGQVWLGALGGGLVRYDGETTVPFLQPGAPSGGSFWWPMVEDRRGRIWHGTSGGLTVYDPERLTVFTSADGLADDGITALAQDARGRVLLGDRLGGLTRYDGEGFEILAPAGQGRNSVTDILVDRSGSVWLTTLGTGILRHDGHDWRAVTPGLEIRGRLFPWWVLEDRNGVLWFTTTGVPFRYDGTSFEELDNYRDVWAPYEDRQGTIWLGGEYGSVFRAGDDGPVLETGLAEVEAILEDRRGIMWFGGAEGIARYDGTEVTTDTLGCKVEAMAEDRDGVLWLATSAGVLRHDGRVFQELNLSDGLPTVSILDILEDQRGDMWLATPLGAVRYRPRTGEPVMRITDVVAGRRRGPVGELAVPSTQGLIAFEFAAPSFTTSPGQMLYLYRLDGIERDWQQTRQNRVEYRELPRGEYTFLVQAVDRDLNYSREPAVVRVRVHLPYERVAWLSLLGLAVLGLVWQGSRVVRRDRQLHAANEELVATNASLGAANQQIEEATRNKSEFLRRMSHDLRSPMNAIIGYTRLVLRRAQGKLDERQLRNLQNIQTSADNLLNLINDILDLSRIEAGHIELQVREADLCQLVEECADTLAPLVKPAVELARQLEPVPTIQTDPDRLRQVVMNLLGNAAKFTDEGSITVSLRPTDSGAELQVADTGVGIPPGDLPHIFDEFRQVERQGGEQTEGTGLGLSIARKIVELLGGTIGAESDIGAGTTFTVRIGDGQVA